MKQLRIASLCYLCLCCLAAVLEASEQAPPGAVPSEITGTVRINGWIVDGSRITVQAVPMGVRSSDGRRFTPDPRATVRTTVLENTEDPHTFSFSLVGLQPATLYRLGIEAPPPPDSPKIFWRGPMQGLAVSGGPPIAIEGFAARTELEIRDSAGDWVGADDLQFTTPESALRSLRWKSTIPGMVSGELQISTEPFPTQGAFGPCDQPDGGIVYRKQFFTRGSEWQEIDSLDFHQILMPTRASPIDGTRDNVLVDTQTEGASPTAGALSAQDYQMLLIGSPVYLRVVPVTASGPACNLKEDGVHGWVVLAKLPGSFTIPEPAKDPPVLDPYASAYIPPIFPQWPDGQLHPSLAGDVVYKVIKDHTVPPCGGSCYSKEDFFKYAGGDPLGYGLVTMGLVPPSTKLSTGTVFSFIPGSTSSDGGLLGTIGDLATGLVTGVVGVAGDLVTWMAEVSESVKNGVAKVVAGVITDLPVIGEACNAVVSCEDVVKAGITYGLTSMGIPPSLPNWNELKDQGMDYLTAEVASEIATQTGLPQELAQLGAEKTMEVAQGMATKTIAAMTVNQGTENGPQYDWVLPYMGMDPAVWRVWVRKSGTIELPSNLFIRTMSDGLFIQGAVHLPKVFPPNNEISIPIVLQPDYSKIPAPLCMYGLGTNTCVPNPSSTKPLCSYTQYNWNTHQYEWKTAECSKFDNRVDIYYRDYWVTNHLNSGACVSLSGVSMTDTQGLWLPYYPPFVEFGRIPPTQPAFWAEPFFWHLACK